jgi:hypothetical protein
MKTIKLMLSVLVLAIAALTAIGASQDSWNLGSSDDWLSTGPVYFIGPYYYPNSDLSNGTQGFLNTYPSYLPFDYSNYYQTYYPVMLNKTGTYTTPNNYLPVSTNYYPGYNNQYFNDPQSELDLAIANHANQKFLTNYYSRHHQTYPWQNIPY